MALPTLDANLLYVEVSIILMNPGTKDLRDFGIYGFNLSGILRATLRNYC